jgi:hypothetical protein
VHAAFLGPSRCLRGAIQDPITPPPSQERRILTAGRKGLRLAVAAAALACATPDTIPRPPEFGGRVWSRPGATPADFDLDRASCETDFYLRAGRYLDESRRLPHPEDLEPCLRARGWRPQEPTDPRSGGPDGRPMRMACSSASPWSPCCPM